MESAEPSGRSPGPRAPAVRTSPLTAAELDAVLRLLTTLRPRPRSLVVGSSRDEVSREAARLLAAQWESAGGTVLDIVNWPEDAASWLRQARRFAAGPPDAWAVTGQSAGWARMGRRLALSTCWDPARTVATSSLAREGLITLGGAGTFEGLRGAHRDGGAWEVGRTPLTGGP